MRCKHSDGCSAFDESNAITEQESFGYVVRDKDDRRTEAFLEQLELALQFRSGQGIERSERLIHKQNWRICGECASKSDALPLAAGKFMRIAPCEVLIRQSYERKYLGYAAFNPARIPAFDLWDQGDVPFHRVMRKEADLLNRISDTAAQLNGIPLMGGATLDAHFSPSRRKKPVDELESCCLSGAASAEQDQNFRRTNCQIEIRDEGASSVNGVVDVDELDCWL